MSAQDKNLISSDRHFTKNDQTCTVALYYAWMYNFMTPSIVTPQQWLVETGCYGSVS